MTWVQALVIGGLVVAAVIGFAAGWLLALDHRDHQEVEQLAVRGRHAESWPRTRLAATGELAQLYVGGYPEWEGQSWHAFMQGMRS